MAIDSIRDTLNAQPRFWSDLHRAFDLLGFDEAFVRRLPPVSPDARSKYIKDKVWGMMEFAPDELAIIDSPLLQRLRRISQLGLTFLTYPGAEHSRFVHTLGVTHVVKRLLRSIGEVAQRDVKLRAGGEEYTYYNPDGRSEQALMRSLTHAALLHDTGHLAFSHAGESAFMAHSHGVTVGGMDLEDFIQVFREASFESGLSECLSIAVCLSPRFKAFYEKITGPHELDRRIGYVCSFIGGVPHHPAYPGLANIISGAAIDADKIDYLNRDALECGIPAGVDVSRIFLNSALVEIQEAQAAMLSRSRGRHAEQMRFTPGTHFIVNSTGIDTYDELANAKAVLYQRVYLHQLTRNAEQVLAGALHAAMNAAPPAEGPHPGDVLSWFEYGDDELLAHLSRDPASKPLASRLISRDLPKRAFALFRDVCEPFVALPDLFDPGEWGDAGAGRLSETQSLYARRTAWRQFDQVVPMDPSDRPQRIEELRDAVRREAVEARAVLDPGFRRERLRVDEPYIGISPRVVLKPISEVLVREKNSIGYSSQWTKSEELTTADNIGRGVDYVHADADWLPYVTIACTKVLYDFHAGRRTEFIQDGTAAQSAYDSAPIAVRPRLHLRLEDICSRIGVDYGHIVTEMTRAARGRYFGAAERVVPLDRAQFRSCEEVAQHYSSFLGERGWHVTERSVAAFVRQFPVALRSEMLRLLLQGEFIGRGVTRSAMDQVALELEQQLGRPLVFCRFSPNSGSFTGMILEQERRQDYQQAGHVFARNLADLEQQLAEVSPACIVFVDDQFATGGQACAQLLHWAGKPRGEWPAELRSEQNIDNAPLGQKTREVFGSGNVALAFSFGTSAGKARVERTARELGFPNLQVLFKTEIRPEPIPMSADLRDFLARVGYELLKRARHHRDDGEPLTLTSEQEDSLRADALGYGGTASIMVTPFSAPSHTITALWCPGLYQDQPWIPLLLRRGYRRQLVLG
ncbi:MULTISPECIES: phosphoribosyltransferase-like protein [Microvirga]|uniref:HD domain-containing protein n=2 Tax=Microvirga TaxID=186650 RepID=A0ABW9Z6G8_9HYPH|nr:HD domain-containing protein [Microvirga arsenatis]NBJ13073.1 HD domain-containing protein [Microvirga arsenatis]NBJ26808.1 HD domain-containing protein [Microvirga arsenatis]